MGPITVSPDARAPASTLIPPQAGKPMQEAEYLALSTAAKKALEERRSEIEEKVEAALREGKKLEREINEKLMAIETQAGEYLVRIPLAELRERYQDYPKILSYFDAVRDHILKNLQRFNVTDAAPNLCQMTQIQMAEPPADPFLPYRVNVFVANSDTQGSPIIIETNPACHNLFGVVE